jgi:DNA polymerase III delta prime subunit
MSKDFLWVEKYRPRSIGECILPENLLKTFNDFVVAGELPNMLLTGTAGLGKTTVARALCNELGLDHIIINGSEEGNIDTLRGKIKQFASSVSLQGGYKVVILDEADYLNPQSTQPALRGFIEEFANNCRFLLTCNFKNRIIEPLHSRCGVYEFNSSKKDMVKLAGEFLKRMEYILQQEGIYYEKKTVVDLIIKHAPDWRRVINECQRYSNNIAGVLEISSSGLVSDNFDDLFKFLKEKDFKSMRGWIVNNMDVDSAAIFRGIYDRIVDKVRPEAIPGIILILADYQYKNAFVADREINMVACMTEIMSSVEFK